MPIASLRCCATPGCPTLTGGTYCVHCAVQKEHARTNFAFRRLYRTARWAQLRSIVLQEEPLCPECTAEGFVSPTTDVHHKEKATAENFFDRSILQALCSPHHSRHTQRGE